MGPVELVSSSAMPDGAVRTSCLKVVLQPKRDNEHVQFVSVYNFSCLIWVRNRFQWSVGLRRGSATARLLGLRFRIPLGA